MFPISIDFYLIFVPNLYLNKKVEVFEPTSYKKTYKRPYKRMSTPYKNTQKNTQKNAQKGLKTLWGGMAFRFDCNDSTTDLYLVKNRISDYVFETEHREIDEDSLTKTIGSVTYEFDEDETFKVIPTSNLKEILKLYRFLFYKIEDTILTALENSWMKEEDN